MTEHYDLIVIDAGPAGEKGATKAAQYGKRVAPIEMQARIVSFVDSEIGRRERQAANGRE